MSKIGEEKRRKIKEEILRILYENNLKGVWTYQIADYVIRNNEFVLKLLRELEGEGLVKEVSGNRVRKRWRMDDRAYKIYRRLF